jgi:hypothetical protein
MFPSISRAIPQTQVTTSFTATRTLTIVPVTAFAIKVNGLVPANPNSVTVNSGDVVTATVTTADDYVWHDFYYYTIDGVTQTFAVVNKSLYSIHVNPEDAKKRWYLYDNTVHNLTFNSPSTGNIPLKLGNRFDSITNDVHVVMDPVSESVYFYNKYGVQLSKVTLPAAPIAYVKVPDNQSIIVLILGGQTYEIYLSGATSGNSPFFAKKDYSEFTGDTSFVAMLPGEDLISYLRRSRSKKTIPPAACITYDGTYIIAAGNGSVWVVDPSNGFRLLNTFDFDEYVLNIAPLPDNQGAVLVTQSQRVYTMTLTGNFQKIYDGIAVWQPALFNGKVYIPDSEHGHLKVYNPVTAQFDPDIVLLEFSPSYTTVANNKLYVCGNDNEKVLVFDSAMNQTELVFPKKVTWISVLDNSYIASHWLENYTLLDVKDLYRIVEINFRSRSGPVSQIGTDENLIIPLGSNEVYAYTPAETWLWLNGKRTYSNKARGTLCVGGDYISINYAARLPGKVRTTCVIGDTAYDYDVEAVDQVYYPRNIDLQIEPPQALNIHTRSITLPKFFTACRMSVEFGVIKVNDAYYYGDDNVYPGDRVTVEINTRGNNALPVFTVGARQFVIPVSTNIGTIAPVILQQTNLNPGTPVNFEVEFGELSSQFDYIIPSYYDISVKKNNIDITGNYYQQFGKGDKLIVEFISSNKKYDIKDVYILGAINYEFRAKNSVDLLVTYLDYGTIDSPYVRQIDLQPINKTEVIRSVNIDYYEEPKVQFTTANLTIAGVTLGYTANISIVGGDSYFVLNGNLVTNTDFIEVATGDQLALARNVMNYFDVPVTVVQHLPTGDEDLYSDQVVGAWGLVNRKIVDLTQSDKNLYDVTHGISVGDVDISADIKLFDTMYALNKAVVRKITTIKEKLDPTTKINSTAIGLTLDSTINQPMNRADYEIDENSMQAGKGSTIQFVKSDVITTSKLGTSKTYQSNRTIFASDQKIQFENTYRDVGFSLALYNENSFKDIGYSLQFATVEAISSPGLTLEPDVTRILFSSKFNTTKTYQSNRTIFSADQRIYFENNYNDIGLTTLAATENVQNSTVTTVEFNQYSDFDITASNGESFSDVVSVAVGNRSQHLDFKTEKTGAAGQPVRHTETVTVMTASKIRSFLETLSVVTMQNPKFAENTDVVDNSARTETIKESYNIVSPGSATLETDALNVDASSSPTAYTSYELPKNFIKPTWNNIDLLLDSNYQWQGFVWPEINNPTSVPTKELATEQVTRAAQTDVDKHQTIESRTFDPVSLLDEPLSIIPSVPLVQGNGFKESITAVALKQGLNYQLNVERPLKEIKSLEISVKEESSHLQNSLTKSGQLFDLYSSEASSEQTKIVKFELSKAMRIGLDLTPDGNKHYIVLTAEYRTEQLNLIRPIANQFITYYDDPQGTGTIKYSITDAENYSTANMDYDTGTIGYLTLGMDYQPADPDMAAGIGMQYQREIMLGDMSVAPEYKQETWSDSTGSIDFQRERELPGVTSYLPMERFYLGAGTSDKNNLSLIRYGKTAEVLLDYRRERPEYYYPSDRTQVEFEQGIVWDNDIEVDYGAFATTMDAEYAARYYQSFRPYLIMDTDLWTYRVLIDTNLVCALPKGRYPIAWLMRGG